MYRKAPYNFIPTLFVGISISGMIISLMLAVQAPSSTELEYLKPLIGAIFTVFLVFGVVAAATPRICSGASSSKAGMEKIGFHSKQKCKEGFLVGHHPDCERFSAHVIKIRGRYLCAACTGLFFGGLIDLVVTFLYFFCGWEYKMETSVIVLIGIMAVSTGFFQVKFSGFIRSLLNVSFVVGGFLILSGIDQSKRSLSYDLFVFSLIVFWLITRIFLSQWDHDRICESCDSSAKVQ